MSIKRSIAHKKIAREWRTTETQKAYNKLAQALAEYARACRHSVAQIALGYFQILHDDLNYSQEEIRTELAKKGVKTTRPTLNKINGEGSYKPSSNQ
mgnify:CR=1 FL=1